MLFRSYGNEFHYPQFLQETHYNVRFLQKLPFYMQLKYGCGSDVTQMVWINEREMSKYDENYAEINTEVAAMDDAIQPVPPTPQFDDLTAEDAASLRTPLGDTFEVWADAFITGKKSTDTDWDAYVAEMKNLSIDQYLQMYNDNNK